MEEEVAVVESGVGVNLGSARERLPLPRVAGPVEV